MQASVSFGAPDTSTTLSLACLCSEASCPASHFTGKERDAESGNDYFGARYYASTTGRFLSPDPAGPWVADSADPQTWNMYTYGLNNPLINTDLDGLDCVYFNADGAGIDGPNGIDHNSNSGECGANGGDWVNGTVRSATYFAGSDAWAFQSSDSSYSYLTYAYAPSSEANATGATCTGNCDLANGYSQTAQPGFVPLSSFALDQLIRPIAKQAGPVLHMGDCAAAAAMPFAGVVSPEDAQDLGGYLMGQAQEKAEDKALEPTAKGLDKVAESAKVGKGMKTAAKFGGKVFEHASPLLSLPESAKNLREAGCTGGTE
jgi:RHS repeat-associated protein